MLVTLASLSASLAKPHGGGDCTSDDDCQLNGECVAGRCHCDLAWTGHNCSYLNSMPTAGSASDGLYHDSTGGVAPDDKVVTARYSMTTYNTAMVIHLGMLMMFPLFLEHTVRHNISYAVRQVLRHRELSPERANRFGA